MSGSIFPEQAVQRVEAPGVSPQLLAMNHGGLTKRELFAAMIAQGIWSNASALAVIDKSRGAQQAASYIAEQCATQADALIAEIAK